MAIQTQVPTKLAIDHPAILNTEQGGPASSIDEWEKQKEALRSTWWQYLGESPFPGLPLNSRIVRRDDLGDCLGHMVYIQTEPDYAEQCYLLVPKERTQARSPAVVVFYYDVDVPAGHDMGSRHWSPGLESRHFARHLARRGYVALVQRWFHEGYAEALGTSMSDLRSRYMPGVKHFQREFPAWKGLGRVVWDASRCIDHLISTGLVDPMRIGCMGHSLGGKMALYAGAFDPRFKVVVSSEPGIALAFSNWDAPWYLGPEVRSPGFDFDHHQLLALTAPRPFLLIAGEDADGDRSWPYLASAQDVYRLYGAEDRIGMLNHRAGHTPTTEAAQMAYGWFDRWL